MKETTPNTMPSCFALKNGVKSLIIVGKTNMKKLGLVII